MARQRALVADLKTDFAFVYRVYSQSLIFPGAQLAAQQKPGLDGKPKSGFMRNPVIQQTINRVWFKSTNEKGDAITLKEFYKPFPHIALALVLTAVRSFVRSQAIILT
jgi:hypothetical protein